jgi:hypothetical protein
MLHVNMLCAMCDVTCGCRLADQASQCSCDSQRLRLLLTDQQCVRQLLVATCCQPAWHSVVFSELLLAFATVSWWIKRQSMGGN